LIQSEGLEVELHFALLSGRAMGLFDKAEPEPAVVAGVRRCRRAP
jgi:hypothetical protein